MSFFDSFKKSDLKYKTQYKSIQVNIDEINEGSSQNENFLFQKDKMKINDSLVTTKIITPNSTKNTKGKKSKKNFC